MALLLLSWLVLLALDLKGLGLRFWLLELLYNYPAVVLFGLWTVIWWEF